jgi:hypothetical protein
MEIINKICDGVQARAELGLYSSLIVMLQQLVEKKLVDLVEVIFLVFSSQSRYQGTVINHDKLKDWLSIFREISWCACYSRRTYRKHSRNVCSYSGMCDLSSGKQWDDK